MMKLRMPALFIGLAFLVTVVGPAMAAVTLKVDFDEWSPPPGINSSALKSDIMNRVRSNFDFAGTAVNVVSNCNTPGDISIVVSNRRTDDKAWGEVVNGTRGVAWGGEFNTGLPAEGFTNVTTFGRAISGTIAHEAGHLLNATHVVSNFEAKMQKCSDVAEKALTDRHFTPANQSNILRSAAGFGAAGAKEGSVMMIRGVGSASVPGHEDSNVDVMIHVDNQSVEPIEFGYIDNGGGFVSFFDIPPVDLCDRAATFYPGEVVEFAIRADGGLIYSMASDAEVDFAGPITPEMSYEPILGEQYWAAANAFFLPIPVTATIHVSPDFAGDGLTMFQETGVPALDELTVVMLSLILAGYVLYLFTRRRKAEREC